MKLVAQVSRVALSASTAFPLFSALTHAQVAGEMRGRVRDAATAKPVVNGRVEVSGRTEAVRTGADGSYIVRGLEPNTYVVSVRAIGYAVFTREVEVVNGRTAVFDAALMPRVAILGDVRIRAQRDTSAVNATVFDRTAIEQSGRRDLGELLQTAPGIVVTLAGGPGQSSRVSIRGSSSNQVLVLLDGVPLNSAISGSADLSRVALETVDRVTVRTGAQSARYGPGAMAGVIEIDTRKPRQEVSTFLRTGALGEHSASLALGNATPMRALNLGASLSADYRTVEGDFTYTLPALRGGGRATRINSNATSTQVLGGVSLDGAFGSIAWRGTWQDTERGLAGTIIQPSSTGRQGHERLSTGASAQGLLQRVAWTLATDITHERGTFDDATPPFGQAFNDTINATSVTASTSATAIAGATTHSIGAELRTLDIRSTMLSPDAPHWQRLLGAWGNTRYSHALPRTDVQFDLELSARVDRNSLTSDAAFSPRGLMRLSRGAVSTSFSVGSGYAPPTLSDQFFHEGVQVRANPALRPERTRRDIEGRLTIRETAISAFEFSGEAAAFRSNVDGMILWLPDFRFIWSPTNYDVDRSGWELSGKVGAPAIRTEMRATLNRNDVTYAGGVINGQVAYRPRNSANISVAFAPKQLRVDVTNRYIGVRRTIAGSGLNALDPYWMSDVKISTAIQKVGWSFGPALGVENVLNRAAAMLVDYPFPPRTWSVSVRVRRSTSQPS
ncbi:MAG: TonB-dependent receptor [Gemmatimonadaceae bacterium]